MTGKTGAFCKHQCLLMHCLKIHLTNGPALNSIDRCNLAGVALREQRPPQSFFREFSLDTVTEAVCEKTESSSGYQIENISCNIIPNSKKENSQKEVSSRDGEENYASEKEKNDVLLEVKRVMSLNVDKKCLQKFKKCLETIRTDNALHQRLIHMNAVFSSKRQRKIRVQPTSISRRRIGVTKRSTAVPFGRPSKFNRKRKHSLKKSIEKNIPSLKK